MYIRIFKFVIKMDTKEMVTVGNSSNNEMILNSSSTDNETEIHEGPPMSMVLTATSLYIVIFMVGIIGNILVMAVILTSKSMKTTVNMYLMNLCLADVLVIMVCMPTALADIYTKEAWYFGGFMCRFVPFLENVVANTSVLTILAISVERYRVVRYPLKAVLEETFTVWKVILSVWVISIVCSVPWLFIAIYRDSQLRDGTAIKVCRNPIREPWMKIFIVVTTCIFFLIPCLVLFALNSHLCWMLGQSDELDTCTNKGKQDRHAKKRQVANIIASIVAIFFFCHLPFRVAGLWFTFADIHDIASLGLLGYFGMVYSLRVLFYLNHALNPVIYNFVSTKFRCALRQMFPRHCRRTKRGFTQVSSRRFLFGRNYSTETHARDSRQELELSTRLEHNEFLRHYE